MEKWEDGTQEEYWVEKNISTFYHYSNIPLFQNDLY